MNQRETFEPALPATRGARTLLKEIAPTAAAVVSILIAHFFGGSLFSDLHNYPLTILLFLWLFGTMMWCAFSVVRHAEAVAEKLGEPYGTLVLTLSVIVIEVSLLAAIMLHGAEQPDTCARRHVRHADDRAERHGRRGPADGRAPLLGAGIQSRRRPGLPHGHRRPCRIRADHPELHKDRARPEPGADQGAVVRHHHRSVLHRVRCHPDRAAPRLFCRAGGQWPTRYAARRGAAAFAGERIARVPYRHAAADAAPGRAACRSISPSSSISASRISTCPMRSAAC